jgi:hypothetical protein
MFTAGWREEEPSGTTHRFMRELLAILCSFLAALAAAAVIWLWWRSPIPTFYVFTPLLQGILLGVALHSIGAALDVKRSWRWMTVAAVCGYVSAIGVTFGQYWSDANDYHHASRRATALLAPPAHASGLPAGLSVLDSYDWNVIQPRTGKTGIRGYTELRFGQPRWRAWLRFGETLIVIVTTVALSAPAQRGARVQARPGDPRFSIPRPLAYLWALPTTLVGLIFIPASLLSGGGVQVVDGVLEVYGGLTAAFLRHCTPLRGGASAMTLGHVVIGRDRALLDFTRNHERVHVRQAERWGPLFIPAYLIASVLVYFRGGRAYEDNPFEREAYALDQRGEQLG